MLAQAIMSTKPTAPNSTIKAVRTLPTINSIMGIATTR
jgi:hypothetical protein